MKIFSAVVFGMSLLFSLIMTTGCNSPTQVETKYVHDTLTVYDTVEVEPYSHVGTWEVDDISYTDGNKGIWRLTLTAAGTFSFSRLDTTDDTESRYYFGTYSADGETMDLYATSVKVGRNGTTSTISKHDLCSYTHYENTSGEYLRITENGPDYIFNTADFMRFDKSY